MKAEASRKGIAFRLNHIRVLYQKLLSSSKPSPSHQHPRTPTTNLSFSTSNFHFSTKLLKVHRKFRYLFSNFSSYFRNEFLAVRNAEGSFYVCQAMQNIYKSSRRIRIRWLSQDKNNGEIYSPDFYDFTDFDCILTNLNLNKIDKNKFQLTKFELLRTENILKRAIDVEAGVSEKPRVTEEHPDGREYFNSFNSLFLRYLRKEKIIGI